MPARQRLRAAGGAPGRDGRDIDRPHRVPLHRAVDTNNKTLKVSEILRVFYLGETGLGNTLCGHKVTLGHPDHPGHDPALVERMLGKLHALVEKEIGDERAPFDLCMFGTRRVRYRKGGER